jgi:hypothetical protein
VNFPINKRQSTLRKGNALHHCFYQSRYVLPRCGEQNPEPACELNCSDACTKRSVFMSCRLRFRCGNGMIFPRCSGGIHFPLCFRNSLRGSASRFNRGVASTREAPPRGFFARCAIGLCRFEIFERYVIGIERVPSGPNTPRCYGARPRICRTSASCARILSSDRLPSSISTLDPYHFTI